MGFCCLIGLRSGLEGYVRCSVGLNGKGAVKDGLWGLIVCGSGLGDRFLLGSSVRVSLGSCGLIERQAYRFAVKQSFGK